MSEYPVVGQPLELRDLDGGLHLSRVEGIAGSGLTVARPGDLRVGEVHSEGTRFTAAWSVAGGVHSVPVELLGTRTDGSLRVWDMAIVGAIEKQQRRSYVRVPLSGSITVHFDEPSLAAPSGDTVQSEAQVGEDDTTSEADPQLLTGQLVDISEAALAAEFRTRLDDPRLETGTELSARFLLHNDEFVLRGTILNATLGSTTRVTRIVVLLAHSDADADRIRQHVFTIQREIRQAERNR